MSNGNRQHYRLDRDDDLQAAFMTRQNTEALIQGANESGSDHALAVGLGGTGSREFTDGQLIKYSAATGRLVSSGIVGVLPGGNSVFIPHETGVLYSKEGLDTAVTSDTDVLLASQAFTLPENSQWADLQIHFGFKLSELSPGLTGLRVLLGDDGQPAPTLIMPPETQEYNITGAGDSAYVHWICMGSIPDERKLDNPLRITLRGSPQDAAVHRTLLTRLSYSGVVPASTSAAQKGVPVFLPASPIIYQGAGPTPGWVTYDCSAAVPAGASAVILQTFARSSPVEVSEIVVRTRPHASSTVNILLGEAWTGDDNSRDTTVTQAMAPFLSDGAVRSFQYTIGGQNLETPITLRLLGYIT